MRFSTSTIGAVLGLSAIAQAFNEGAVNAFKRPEKFRREHARRSAPATAPESQPLVKRQSKFMNPQTAPFAVNGTGVPEVDFDIGESYSGLLPISQAPDESRQLFFWFFPSTNPDVGLDEVTIWFTGGPGCSSLSGFLTENGPFLWQSGKLSFRQQPVSTLTCHNRYTGTYT